MKRIQLLLALFLFVQMSHIVHAVNPLPQSDGQAYVVQTGDWLSKLADKFYGDTQAWSTIVEATNAKATSDSTFTPITDPNRIEVGQKLWIPASLTGGTSSTEPIPAAPNNPADLQQAYLNAVKDAATVE